MSYDAGWNIRGALELDKNFTIPRKKPTDTLTSDIPQSSNGSSNSGAAIWPPLPPPQPGDDESTASFNFFDSYYDYQPLHYGQPTSQFNGEGKSVVQKRPREQPKYQEGWIAQSYKDTFGDLNDATLPKELKLMFQPLYCKLCAAQLNSSINAKNHYNSKVHHKKIKRWLTEYSEKTGEPLHKRARVTVPKLDGSCDDRNFYCEICDLPLTGKLHADSHYMGKNHQKALHGKKPPAGKGFYNEEGKWIRTTPMQSDTTGRDGFGQAFILSNLTSKSTALDVSSPVTLTTPITPVTTTTTSCNPLRCDTCQVAVSSPAHMEAHLLGARHRKKLKQLSLGSVVNAAAAAAAATTANSVHELTATMADSASVVAIITEVEDILSSFRTPSGQFYCNSCNLSVNSESQFKAHLQSKKHLKKKAGTKD